MREHKRKPGRNRGICSIPYLSVGPMLALGLKEVLIEEELGQNPESGEGWTEYNFQARICIRLPYSTHFTTLAGCTTAEGNLCTRSRGAGRLLSCKTGLDRQRVQLPPFGAPGTARSRDKNRGLLGSSEDMGRCLSSTAPQGRASACWSPGQAERVNRCQSLATYHWLPHLATPLERASWFFHMWPWVKTNGTILG